MILPRAVGIHLKSLKQFFTMNDQVFNANSKGERIIHRWDLRSLSLAKKQQANHEQTWMLSRFLAMFKQIFRRASPTECGDFFVVSFDKPNLDLVSDCLKQFIIYFLDQIFIGYHQFHLFNSVVPRRPSEAAEELAPIREAGITNYLCVYMTHSISLSGNRLDGQSSTPCVCKK